MKQQKIAFTFIELIISVTIITILSSIGFYSYVGHLSSARDSQRTANMGVLESAFKNYKQDRGAYSYPGDYFNITNSGTIVAYQGKINKNMIITTIDDLPLDPSDNQEYGYSITKNKQENQIAITLENGDFPTTMLKGDYHSVAFNVLPTIMLAISSGTGTNVEIHTGILDGSDNRQKFILDQGKNLLYDFDEPYNPVYAYEGLDLWNDIILEGKVNYWNNSDYRTCTGIYDAGKSIGDGEYQILNSSGTLENTTCTF